MRIAKILLHSTIGLSMILYLVSPAALFWATRSAQATAGVATTMGYQGRLRNTSTGVAQTGSFAMTFDLYDASSGGTALWTESETVTVTNGYFSATLGDSTALPTGAIIENVLFLSVTVAGETITSRIPIQTTPYAFVSRARDTAATAPTTNLFDGRMYYDTAAGSLNVYSEDEGAWHIVASTLGETIAHTSFAQAGGNDEFVAGMFGVEGNVFTDSSFIAGAMSGSAGTTFGDGVITDQGGDFTITTGAATDDVLVSTGNLKVGNGTPDATLDGEDLYVEGTFEVDGAVRFDSNPSGSSSVLTLTSTSAAGSILDLNVNPTAASTVQAIDIDVTGSTLGIVSGNAIDIAYSSLSHTGIALNIATGTNIVGDAIHLEGTGVRTGNQIDINTDETGSGALINVAVNGIKATGGNVMNVDVADTINSVADILNFTLNDALGAGALVVDVADGARTDAIIDITTATTGSATDAAAIFQINSSGALDTLANVMDINMVGGAASNVLDITTSTAATSGNMIDLNFGAVADTGDGINVALGGTAVAAQALVITATGASTTDGWAMAVDNTGNGLWTGDMINLRTGTADVSGDVFDLTMEAGATDAQAFVVTNAATSDQAGWLMDVDTSAAWTANMVDIDMGAGISTANVLDVTYASVAHSGNAIDLNMGTNVAGDAVNIASAATTGNAIDITSSGIFTNELIDINVGAQAATGDVMNIALGATAVAAQALVVDSAGASSTDGWVLSGDNSGNGIWTGDMINLRSGTGDASGDFVGMVVEALATDVQAITISNAAASDQAGWLLDVDTSAAWTGIAIDADFDTAASTGNFLDVTYATAAHTGNAVDLNMGTNVGGDAVNIASAATTGNAIDITSSGAFTDSLIDIDAAAGDWQGNIFEITTGGTASDGDVFNTNLEALDVAVQYEVVSNAAATTANGWLMDLDTSAAWTGIAIDADFDTAASTGNFLDVTYATAAHTGNAIDLNMGTNVGGDAVNIAQTNPTTGNAIQIDTTLTDATAGVIDVNITTDTDAVEGLNIAFTSAD